MSRKPTLGNLFSGSGTWELAAEICGIDVLFEAEIEPFPVALEAKRFPNAIQLGDVSKINGAEIPPVDIFCSSSPCQDLSIAGKRAGLEGQRSGLFTESIRITKEMLDADRERLHGERSDDDIRYLRPRFWCWENVPGSFSSNKGEDFRIIIEEIARLSQKDAVIPLPKGGWSYAGVVEGEGWQIAWRTMDAQYYGVAQRRRRVFLVADLRGYRAAEVLFERESVSWNFTEIANSWKDTSRSLRDRISEASRIVMDGVRSTEDDGRLEETVNQKNG